MMFNANRINIYQNHASIHNDSFKKRKEIKTMFNTNRINIYRNNISQQIKFGKRDSKKGWIDVEQLLVFHYQVSAGFVWWAMYSAAELLGVIMGGEDPSYRYYPPSNIPEAQSAIEDVDMLLNKFEQELAKDEPPSSGGYDKIHIGLKKVKEGSERLKAEMERELQQAERGEIEPEQEPSETEANSK